LMAPMVDRTVVRFPSQVGSAGLARAPEADRDLARSPKPFDHPLSRLSATLLGSRVPPPTPSIADREVGADPAGV
jgi:hypothetical protein